jgi:hypothetical protein
MISAVSISYSEKETKKQRTSMPLVNAITNPFIVITIQHVGPNHQNALLLKK